MKDTSMNQPFTYLNNSNLFYTDLLQADDEELISNFFILEKFNSKSKVEKLQN